MARIREIDPQGKVEAIMVAAETLFAQKGFASTSIAEIAKMAGVAVGSVYRFVPDKASLLAKLHERVERRMIEAMIEGWNGASRNQDRFAVMIDRLFDRMIAHQPMIAVLGMTKHFVGTEAAAPGAEIIKAIEELYVSGVAQGFLRKADPKVNAAIAYGMVEGAMRAAMGDPAKTNVARVKKEVVDALNHCYLKP